MSSLVLGSGATTQRLSVPITVYTPVSYAYKTGSSQSVTGTYQLNSTGTVYIGSSVSSVNTMVASSNSSIVLHKDYSGGGAAVFNNNISLFVPAPSTATVVGSSLGNSTIDGTGGGNVNYYGGGGFSNTISFTPANAPQYIDWDHWANYFSLVMDLHTNYYTYQQLINGVPMITGGTVANIQRVVGPANTSALIAGDNTTLSINGGGGSNNIIYGGGGRNGSVAAALYATNGVVTAAQQGNGGDGNNWVIFQDPIQPGASLISGLVNLPNNYTANSVSTPLTVDLTQDSYTFTAGGLTSTGVLSGFANILGATGFNNLVGDVNKNILVGSLGNDTINGGGGVDTLYGGGGANVLIGGATGASRDTYVTGYDYNPVTAHANTSSGYLTANIPTLPAFGNGNDGQVIGGSVVPGGPTPSIISHITGTDNIMDWQYGDSLYVSSLGTAVINALSINQDGVHNTESVGLVDLTQANNYGTVVVPGWVNFQTANTSTVVKGTPLGTDQIFTHPGTNTINLSTASTSNIYINSYQAKTYVTGFNAATDKIYLDTGMLSSFGITSTTSNEGAYGSAYGGQTFYAGENLISWLSDPVYMSALNAQSSSNGAFTNAEHSLALTASQVASYTTGAGIILTGTALVIGALALEWNPFTLAAGIAMAVAGGVLIGVGIAWEIDSGHIRQHTNTTYTNDNHLTGLANAMNVLSAPSAPTSWTATDFLSFYNPPNDRFVPSLEVTGASSVHTVALVHAGGETYVYLINSPDKLIQSGEAYLLAEVNGDLSPSNIVSRNLSADPATSPYLSNATPPPPYVVTYTINAHTGYQVAGALTNDRLPTFTVNLNSGLTSGNTLKVYQDGVLLSTVNGSGASPTSITFQPTAALADGSYNFSVTVQDSTGFQTTTAIPLAVETVAPGNTTSGNSFTYTATADAISGSYVVSGTFAFQGYSVGANSTPIHTVAIAGGSGTYDVLTANNNQFSINPVAQSTTAAWLTAAYVLDSLGNTTATEPIPLGVQPYLANGTVTTELPYLGVGTAGADNFGTVPFSSSTVVYGFGGSDQIVGAAGMLTFYGGVTSNPSALVYDTITTGSGGGQITGTNGPDRIDLRASYAVSDTINIADGYSVQSAWQRVQGFRIDNGTYVSTSNPGDPTVAADRLSFSSAPNKVVSFNVSGTVHASDVISVTVDGTVVNYTVQASDVSAVDPLAQVTANLMSALQSGLNGLVSITNNGNTIVMTGTSTSQQFQTSISGAAVSGLTVTTPGLINLADTASTAIVALGMHYTVSSGVVTFTEDDPASPHTTAQKIAAAMALVAAQGTDVIAAFADAGDTWVVESGHTSAGSSTTATVVQLVGLTGVTALGDVPSWSTVTHTGTLVV